MITETATAESEEGSEEAAGNQERLGLTVATASLDEPQQREEAAGQGGDTPPVVAQNPLTDREEEVAELLAMGMRYKAIAECLILGKGTARKHCQNIAGKWGIKPARLMALQQEARQRGYPKRRSG